MSTTARLSFKGFGAWLDRVVVDSIVDEIDVSEFFTIVHIGSDKFIWGRVSRCLFG